MLARAAVLALWQAIQRRLDREFQDWRSLVAHLGQVEAVERREAGHSWSNDEVFEALLRAVLSNHTDWAKIERVLPELHEVFLGFHLDRYASADDQRLDVIIAWFRERKAGSMTLRRGLFALRRTARILRDVASVEGSAERYFLNVVRAAGGDPRRAAVALGEPGSPSKLPGLGIPLAAEALRNLGFDLCKPDRHLCRAVASFGLVRFRNWPRRDGWRAPAASSAELLACMTAIEEFARIAGERTTYVDNAIWLLCARMGAHLDNAGLVALAAGQPA